MKALAGALALAPLSVALPALGVLATLARARRSLGSWGGFLWAWAALALWGLLAAAGSGDFAAALGPWALGLVPVLAFGAGFAACRSARDYDALAGGVALAGAVASAVALGVWLSGYVGRFEPLPGLVIELGWPGRANGIWGHPNHFGAFAALALMALLGRLPHRPADWRTGRGAGLAAAGALLMTAVVLSGSRGAWLGLVAALALYAATCAPRLGAAALAGVLALAACFKEAVLDRLAALLPGHAAFDHYRVAAWRSALAMVREKPLLGFGPGGWVRDYQAYRLPADTLNQPHPHNYFLQVAVEYGAPACAGLVLLVAWALTVAFRRRDRRGPAALAAATVGIAVMSLVDAPLAEGRMAIAYFALLGAAVSLGQRPDKEPPVAGS